LLALEQPACRRGLQLPWRGALASAPGFVVVA